jgi:hypothetical protein
MIDTLSMPHQNLHATPGNETEDWMAGRSPGRLLRSQPYGSKSRATPRPQIPPMTEREYKHIQWRHNRQQCRRVAIRTSRRWPCVDSACLVVAHVG